MRLRDGREFGCSALVVTTGTFLNGLIHIGPEQHAAGRLGEPADGRLGESLKALGLRSGRLKTGTPPRLSARSIDFERGVRAGHFHVERGDSPIVPFSFMTGRLERDQVVCYQLHTTERVHQLVRENLDRSPLYNGQITGHGPPLLPIDRRQGRTVSGEGSPPPVSGARGPRRGRDLREWALDEPAGRRPAGDGAQPARPRRGGDASSGVCRRVRFHPAHGASGVARDQARSRAVPGRADQRYERIRRGGRPGAAGGRQRRAVGERRSRRWCWAATRRTSA